MSAARWTLLVIGLIAVIAIVRPEQDGLPLGWMALAPVGVLLCGTTYQLLGSRLARLDPPTTTQLYTTWLPVLASLPLVPWVWQAVPDWTVWAATAVMGLCSGIGHLLVLHALNLDVDAEVFPEDVQVDAPPRAAPYGLARGLGQAPLSAQPGEILQPV